MKLQPFPYRLYSNRKNNILFGENWEAQQLEARAEVESAGSVVQEVGGGGGGGGEGEVGEVGNWELGNQDSGNWQK